MTPQVIDQLTQSGIATLTLIVVFVGLLVVLAPAIRSNATNSKKQAEVTTEALTLLAQSIARQNEFSQQQIDSTKKQTAAMDRANELAAQQTANIAKGFSIVPGEVASSLSPQIADVSKGVSTLSDVVGAHVNQADAIKLAILNDLAAKHTEIISKSDGLSSQLTKEVLNIVAKLDEMKVSLLTALADATTGYDPANPSELAKLAVDAIKANGANPVGSEQVA